MTRRKRTTGSEDGRLLEEVHGFCPVCGKSLLTEKRGRQIVMFERAHVYPHSPTPAQQKALVGIDPPSQIESIDNIILLCRDCHKVYDSFTTVADYKEMLARKLSAKSQYEVRHELARQEIGVEEIKSVLSRLETIDVEDLELKMDPLPVSSKIAKGVFRAKILRIVAQYYICLKDLFVQMDIVRANRFKLLATRIKAASIEVQSKDLCREDAFELLVEWFASKTKGRRTVCEIVLAFFIQDCEVFDALP